MANRIPSRVNTDWLNCSTDELRVILASKTGSRHLARANNELHPVLIATAEHVATQGGHRTRHRLLLAAARRITDAVFTKEKRK